MNINQIRNGIKSIYKEADLKMKIVEKICSKGCSHCCYQVIRVHAAEELPITKYFTEELDNQTKSIIKENLNQWFIYFNKNTLPFGTLSEQDIHKFSLKQGVDKVPCPFLINNECSIYPVRPLACRTYSAKDNLTICEINTMRDNDPQATKVGFTSLKKIHDLTGHISLRLLQYAVVEQILNQKLNLKPVLIPFFR